MLHATTARDPLRFAMLPWRPHERRITLALVYSGLLHAFVAAIVAAVLMLRPAADTMRSPQLPLQVTFEVARPVIADLEIARVPEVIPEPAAIVVPAPMPAPPPALVRPVPPVASHEPIYSSSPDGTITSGRIDQPTALGAAIAARLADRYPHIPDKAPRMIGALVAAYPAAARQAHANARISAVLDIDEQGRITAMTLVPDHPWFGPSVTAALKDVHFTPAELATNAVPYWAIIEFVFAIAPAASSSAVTAEDKASGTLEQRVAVGDSPRNQDGGSPHL